MRFGVLGTLEVVGGDGAPLDLGGGQPRLVLAMLLAAAGKVVPIDTIVDALWGPEPPSSAGGTLQSYVSRLRRELEPERPPGASAKLLVWDPPGYRLDVEAEQVDFRRFELLADEGRARLDAAEPAAALEVLREALALWRGPALLDYTDHDFARGLTARLEERRLTALEDRVAADLQLGRHSTVVGELTELVGQHPLREELRTHLALALYRAGRQAEALQTIADLRRTLRDELGVDPGRAIRELELRILEQDADLDAPRTPAAVPPVAQHAPERSEQPRAGGLVGRHAELRQMSEALDEATAGATRFVVVEGEPGIGKSRLLEALAEQAGERGALVLWGRCYEADGAPAFWPWLDVLRGAVEAVADLGTTGGVAQLTGSAPAQPLDPADDARFRLYDDTARLLGRAAAHRPVVVLLDDLQWADVASLELLEALVGRLDDAAVLVVGSVRELELQRNDAVVSALAAMTRRQGGRRIALRGLAGADTALLVAGISGDVSARVAGAIHTRSDGNPFFASQLAQLLLADAVDSDAEMVRRAAVPAGVRDVIRRRLGRLPDATVAMLEVTAVIGRDAEIGLLAAAAGCGAATVLADLEPAVLSRLVAEADPGTFRFVHALVREAVLEEIGPLRRAQLHQRAADAIAALGDDDDRAEILAAHLWAAVALGGRERAAAALERAAEVAVRRFAYEAAEDMLERAARLRRSRGSSQDDLEAELMALAGLAGVRRILHGYARSMEDTPLARAQDLARQTRRMDILTELLWAEWAGAATACDFATAKPLARELLQIGESSDDPALVASGHAVWGIQCWHLGRITEACEHLDLTLSIDADASPLSRVHRSAIDSTVLATGFHVFVHELAGDMDDGEARVAAYAERQEDPYGRTIAWTFGAAAGQVAGDPERAERAARRALQADPDGLFPFFSAAAAMYLANALSEQGRWDEALELFDRELPRYLATRVRTILPVHLSNYAYALLSAGRRDEAVAAMEEAASLLDERGERWTEPDVLMRRAQLGAGLDAPPAEVRALLARAAEVATVQGAHRLAQRALALAEQLGVSADGQVATGTAPSGT